MNDRNIKLLEELKGIEVNNSTFFSKNPALVLERGLGSIVWDAEGREYIDLCAGFGALSLGHAPPEIMGILSEFSHKGENSSAPPIIHGLGDVYASVAKVELFKVLHQLLPTFLEKGMLALSGGQAVEIAIKTATLATSNSGFIVFNGAYHGVDLGVLPFSSREDFRTPFKQMIKGKNIERVPFNCEIYELETAIKKLQIKGHELAAVIVEPIQGRAGVILPKPGWLARVRDFCSKHKSLLVFDEVQTGFGRAGKLTFADEVPCDIACFGKAMGGGFPISACFGTKEVMNFWPDSTGEAIHTGTFFGHPLICQIAAATIKSIIDRKLVERSAEVGDMFLACLQKNLSNNEIKEIRGQGLMIAIEFKKPGLGAFYMDKLRGVGVLALASGEKGECLAFTPALNVEEHLIEEVVSRVKSLGTI